MAKDILLDENGKFLIKNGDFLIEDSDQDHIEDLVRAQKGDFKQHPLTGVGILDYINAPLNREVKTKLEKKMRIQLKADQFEINKVAVESFGKIIIDAELNE